MDSGGLAPPASRVQGERSVLPRSFTIHRCSRASTELRARRIRLPGEMVLNQNKSKLLLAAAPAAAVTDLAPFLEGERSVARWADALLYLRRLGHWALGGWHLDIRRSWKCNSFVAHGHPTISAAQLILKKPFLPEKQKPQKQFPATTGHCIGISNAVALS